MSSKTDAMSSYKGPQRNPKLRFPEFLNAGNWEENKLGELLLIPPTYGVNAPSVPYSNELPTYLRITDISDDGLFLADNKVSVNAISKPEIYLQEGDIVLARTGASVGKSYRYRESDGPLVFAGFLIRVRPDPAKINPILLSNFVSTQNYWKWVRATSARSGQPGINSNEYASLPVDLPAINDGRGLLEQQKIADCFSSIDELITSETRKLNALKVHKKGLMQQLFPLEGETIPRLRFPEFRAALEWQEKSFSEFVTEMESGVSVNSYDSPVMDRSTPGILKTSCVIAGAFLPHENKKIVESETSFARTIPKANTILVSRMNTPLLVGESGYVGADYPNLFLPDRVWRVSCDESIVHTSFFSLYLASDKMRAFLKIVATGTSASMKNISKPTFLNSKLHIPSTIEQEKIADFLGAVDHRIDMQSQRLEALKKHKKGLTQQLFPINEAHL